MYNRPHFVLTLLMALALAGCIESGDDRDDTDGGGPVGQLPEGCDAAALSAQCPIGSAPLLGPAAYASCQGTAGTQLSNESGAIDAVCQGQGVCLVVCNLQDPCSCGIDRITPEGIFCVECGGAPACGNALCEGGEDPTSCPVDCASVCDAGQGRCSGGSLQFCDETGSWRSFECRSDQTCTPSGSRQGLAFCQTRLSPSGGSQPEPEEPPALDSDPRAIALLDTVLDCPRGGIRGCFSIDMFEGGDQILVDAGGETALIDRDSNVIIESIQLEGHPGWQGSLAPTDAQAGNIAWCADDAVRLYDTRDQTTWSMAGFVDDTIELECVSVELSGDGRRVAAGMLLEGAPMVAVWDTGSGDILKLLRFVDAELNISSAATQIAFSPDGAWLVECREDDAMFGGRGQPVMVVWNVEEGRYTRLLQFEGSCAGDMIIRPGHYQVYKSGVLWDMETGEAIWSLGRSIPSGFGGAAFTPDGAVMATDGQNACASLSCTVLLDAETGLIFNTVGATGRRAFSADGGTLMSGLYLYDGAF